MRVIFMGTPDFAVPTLAGLARRGEEIVCVYSRPPRAAGRGMAERRSPVHAFAAAAGFPVRTPASLKGAEVQAAFAALNADVAVIVAYGHILPRTVLEAPARGCLNLHASLLPRWRGAAPIQRAIMAGDEETGVMVMRMEEGLDTGPVCVGERVAIGPDMTAGELHDLLAGRGAELMARALAALSRGALDCAPQAETGVTYAAKIAKTETRIDFARPAQEVHNHIRALSPFPGAWFEAPVGSKRERIKVLRSALAKGNGAPGEVLDDILTVACGAGAVRLVTVQRAGRTPAGAAEFLRGAALPAGTMLR